METHYDGHHIVIHFYSHIINGLESLWGCVAVFKREWGANFTYVVWSLFSVYCMRRFLLNSLGICGMNGTHSNKIYSFKYRKMLIFYKNWLCFLWVQIWSWSKLKTWNKLVLIHILKEKKLNNFLVLERVGGSLLFQVE